MDAWLRRLWGLLRFDRSPQEQVDARIDRVALDQRRRLLRREAALVKDVERILQALIKEARENARQIGRRVADAQAAGLAIQPYWLYQEARATALISLLESRLAQLSGQLAERTLVEMREAINVSLQDSEALVRLAASPQPLAPPFTSVNPLAVEQAIATIGTAIPGAEASPLRELFERIAPAAVERLREVLAQSIAEGWGGRKLGSRLASEVQGITRTKALLIARTETNRAYREAARQSYIANSDVVIGVRWLATMSPRTCAACLSMHGRVFPVDYRMSSHPACRCRLTPITATSLPPLTNADEWLRGQPAAVRRQVLGRIGAAGYDSGHLSLRDLASERYSEDWGWSVLRTRQDRLWELARDRARAAGQHLDVLDARAGRPWPKHSGSVGLDARPARLEVTPAYETSPRRRVGRGRPSTPPVTDRPALPVPAGEPQVLAGLPPGMFGGYLDVPTDITPRQFIRLIRRYDVEVSGVFNGKRAIFAPIVGGTGVVVTPRERLLASRGLLRIHNHPESGAPSPADIDVVARHLPSASIVVPRVGRPYSMAPKPALVRLNAVDRQAAADQVAEAADAEYRRSSLLVLRGEIKESMFQAHVFGAMRKNEVISRWIILRRSRG